MLHSNITPVIRAISLLWRRTGTARIYVLTVASVVIVLAVVGALHLASVGRQSAQSARSGGGSNALSSTQRHRQTPESSSAQPKKTGDPLAPVAQGDRASSQAMPLPMAGDAIADHPVIAITEVAPRRSRGRHGETRVDVKIGVTPQPNVKKGQVEIRVSFFDVTRNGEMRPTEAQVAYEWLTPVRDWTDMTPKYLVATYLHPRAPRRSPERLRYGGFTVRVYFDGQLQDERAEPKGLLAALRSGVQPRSAPGAMPAESPAVAAAVAPSPTLAEAPATKTEVASNAITPAPITPTVLPEKRSVEGTAALPYARPVPGKPGFVYSPFDEKFLIDVRGAPPGSVVNDPNASKAFRVP
jgi:hypothetical protein